MPTRKSDCRSRKMHSLLDQSQGLEEGATSSSEPGRKRKRTAKPDTTGRHVCSIAGCGKTYSRAEHLYRHQLNHNPKQIFHCSWPGCKRHFVRQDLCARHEDRHVARSSRFHPPLPADSPARPSYLDSSHTNLTRASRPDQPADTNQFNAPHGPAASQVPVATADLASDHINGVDDANFFTTEAGARAPIPEDDASHDHRSKGWDSARKNPDVDSRRMPSETVLGQIDRLHSPAWSNTSFDNLRTPVGHESGPDFNAASSVASGMLAAPRLPTSILDNDITQLTFQFPDETTAWLFGNGNYFAHGASGEPILLDSVSGTDFDMSLSFLQDLKVPTGSSSPTYERTPRPSQTKTETIISEASVSENRRLRLIDLIRREFNEAGKGTASRNKLDFLQGDQQDDSHILSKKMMTTYLCSYFAHFHSQIPLIHRPTFEPDKCPDLLLLAMIALGASGLGREHGHATTQSCAELATFLVWNLRWQLFKDEAFWPPAKLWMFQALLLLEFYEKMFATTRALHERAHVHHGTTLNLLRRGSFLVGEAGEEDEVDPNPKGQSLQRWWNAWIAKEATRRAVFTAFFMDTTHALMFGHTAVLAVQELNLPLPVDEKTWSNQDPAEVARAWSGQEQSGFLQALKQTLNGQEVVTSPFGRIVLICGLMSVGWHMCQRDLQVNSLGAATRDLGDEKWRKSLKRSFEHWKRDCDRALDTTGRITEGWHVLYHLAFISLHADIVDIQIFAGAGSLLGRQLTVRDYEQSRQRIVDRWAPSAGAREAAFHAVKLLRRVLSHSNTKADLEYSAREDDQLNRAWVLYYSALVVWCYGFALDGQPTDTSEVTRTSSRKDLVAFLERMGAMQEAEELRWATRRSSCVGLLITLRDLFKETRWALLHEASNLLDKCIEQLMGGADSTDCRTALVA